MIGKTLAEPDAKLAAGRDPGAERSDISLPEIVSALSFALDLTEGAVAGHALRSCLMGMLIARDLGMAEEDRGSLYYALLMKDAGCSSNATRMCEIVGGDDREVKRGIKLQDWTKTSLGTLGVLWKNVLPDANPIARALRIVQMGVHQHRNNEEMIQLRCDRGAQIALKVGLGKAAALAIRHLDEHWDGKGFPGSLKGREIPVASRIMALTQHLDAFASEQGRQAAMDTMQQRSGRWFDPELVKIAARLDSAGRLWQHRETDDILRQVLDLAPTGNETTPTQVDAVCEAFADVVDAKSSFTYRHSVGVTQAALKIAIQLGLAPDRQKLVWRAALLHDIGKLGVSNAILDKPSKLNAVEWMSVRQHPVHTRRILERMEAMREMAVIASHHHEKLDGSGYPYGLSGDELSIEARIIAVADIYGALSEERPYRQALTNEEVFAIIKKDVPEKLDASCFEALMAALANEAIPSRPMR